MHLICKRKFFTNDQFETSPKVLIDSNFIRQNYMVSEMITLSVTCLKAKFHENWKKKYSEENISEILRLSDSIL